MNSFYTYYTRKKNYILEKPINETPINNDNNENSEWNINLKNKLDKEVDEINNKRQKIIDLNKKCEKYSDDFLNCLSNYNINEIEDGTCDVIYFQLFKCYNK